MDKIHMLSLQLLDLLEQYEYGLKNEMPFSEAKELKQKIWILQSELEKQRSQLAVH